MTRHTHLFAVLFGVFIAVLPFLLGQAGVNFGSDEPLVTTVITLFLLGLLVAYIYVGFWWMIRRFAESQSSEQ